MHTIMKQHLVLRQQQLLKNTTHMLSYKASSND
jgi:hypothetical protein